MMKLSQLLLVAAASTQLAAAASTVCTTTFGFDDTAIDKNPFRGFMTYQGNNNNNFPTSLEYDYFPINTLITGNGTYDFSSLDNEISTAAANGNHFVFRVFIDYPSEPRSGLPKYLSQIVAGTPYSGDGGSGTTYDYNNPDLVAAITGLISALGARYDGDNRVAAVQVGFLGHWGEWHTVIADADGTSHMASRQTQLRVLQAYNAAFTRTQLVVSADELDLWGAVSTGNAGDNTKDATTRYRVGWHDDNFCVETFSPDPRKKTDHDFETRLVTNGAADRWKVVPIGGEVQPVVQDKVFTPGFTGQDITQAIAGTHASWLLNNIVFENTGFPLDQRNNAMAIARIMGFVPYVSAVDVVTSNNATAALQIVATVSNRGVAPSYYSLHLTVSVGGSTPVSFGDDLMTLMPGDQRRFTSPSLSGSGAITVGIAGDRLLPNRKMAFAVKGGSVSIASAKAGTCVAGV